MVSHFVQCQFNPSPTNNYLIAGNLCNAFVLGEIGATDDFFLVGSEPEPDSNYPMLTGNILDSDGNTLFRLVRNVLVINPGNCSRIDGDHVGYEITDSAGKVIFQLQTKYETVPESNGEMWITRLYANFYDKRGTLVFAANPDDDRQGMIVDTKSAFGFSGASLVTRMGGMSDEEAQIAARVLAQHGRIHERVSGVIENKTVLLDGKVLFQAICRHCTIKITSGDFDSEGALFDRCKIEFGGDAQRVIDLYKAIAEHVEAKRVEDRRQQRRERTEKQGRVKRRK